MQDLRDYFREHPIIASIRNDSDFKYALNSKTAALFILYVKTQLCSVCVKLLGVVFFGEKISSGFG